MTRRPMDLAGAVDDVLDARPTPKPVARTSRDRRGPVAVRPRRTPSTAPKPDADAAPAPGPTRPRPTAAPAVPRSHAGAHPALEAASLLEPVNYQPLADDALLELLDSPRVTLSIAMPVALLEALDALRHGTSRGELVRAVLSTRLPPRGAGHAAALLDLNEEWRSTLAERQDAAGGLGVTTMALRLERDVLAHLDGLLARRPDRSARSQGRRSAIACAMLIDTVLRRSPDARETAQLIRPYRRARNALLERAADTA